MTPRSEGRNAEDVEEEEDVEAVPLVAGNKALSSGRFYFTSFGCMIRFCSSPVRVIVVVTLFWLLLMGMTTRGQWWSDSSSVLKNTTTPSSAFAMVPTSSCAISTHGVDGIGHQMEAKLSAMATAAMLNLTYVHQPVTRLQHHTDPAAMEQLFGLSVSVPILSRTGIISTNIFQPDTMKIRSREPLPVVGRCTERSWFDNYREHCDNKNDDDGLKQIVWSADNAWDYFWCHVDQLPAAWFDTVVPVLRDTILQGLSDSVDHDGNSHNAKQTLLIVMHMRLGDAGGRQSDGKWCSAVLQNLLQASTSQNDTNAVQVIVHSDAPRETIENMLRPVLGTFNAITTLSAANLTIHGQNDDGASLERVLHDLLTADIMVAAESSLSNVAALLRPKSSVVIHPESIERSGMAALGWYMMRIKPPKWICRSMPLQVCVTSTIKNGKSCAQWKNADEGFWLDLLVRARRHN